MKDVVESDTPRQGLIECQTVLGAECLKCGEFKLGKDNALSEEGG